MEIWVVAYDTEIMGAFRNKKDAYEAIVRDFTDTNKPSEDSEDYVKDWFDNELANLTEEYENCSSFGCADHWFAEQTTLF